MDFACEKEVYIDIKVNSLGLNILIKMKIPEQNFHFQFIKDYTSRNHLF